MSRKLPVSSNQPYICARKPVAARLDGSASTMALNSMGGRAVPIETAAVTLLTLMAAGAGEPTGGLMVMTVRTCADDDRLLTLLSGHSAEPG